MINLNGLLFSNVILIDYILNIAVQNGNINAIIQLIDKKILSFDNIKNAEKMIILDINSGYYMLISFLSNFLFLQIVLT